MKDSDNKIQEVKSYRSLEELPHVPVSVPLKGSIGATGEWRTFRPVIDHDECNSCGMCYLYCPDGVVIYPENSVPKIDYLYCKGCGICAAVCPKKAIDMAREE